MTLPTSNRCSRRKRVVIVGAGPAGLTAAAELLGAGFDISVIEQDELYVGGISRTVQYKGFRFDIGGHRFFSKNQDIVRWWHARLPSDFVTVKRQSRILYHQRFYDYPLRFWNALHNLGPSTSAACLLSYLWVRLFPSKTEQTFEEWVTNRFGRKLFSIFFKTYTEKVWGIPCSQISADWASQRIKGFSLFEAVLHSLRGQPSNGEIVKTLIEKFYYPRLGPGMMWERTREDLERGGVRFYLGRKVEELHCEAGRISSIKSRNPSGGTEEWPGDEFIVSMPLRDTILGMRPRFSEAVNQAASGLSYRDFITVALMIDGEHLFADNWIYIHDPQVFVGRVQNFNNWSSGMVPEPGITCLGFEYFCTVGDPLWARADADLIALAKKEAVQIGLARRGQFRDACVVRMEKAYPVYDRDYSSRLVVIRNALATIENLQPVGRNGMHKYNNQDHSMMTGILAARNLKGCAYNLWNVNTDAEYHESGGSSDVGRTMPQEVTR